MTSTEKEVGDREVRLSRRLLYQGDLALPLIGSLIARRLMGAEEKKKTSRSGRWKV